MEPALRRAYNAAFTPALYEQMKTRLREELGHFPFRIAETPLFLPAELRDHIERSAREILDLLSEPAAIARMSAAIPERYRAPGMDDLPACAQLDFAIARGADGSLEGRIVELQGFPSVYALTIFHGRIFREALFSLPGLPADLTMFFGGLDEDRALDLFSRTVLGGEDPDHVVMLDLDPVNQKTFVDFVATSRLLGIAHACPTELVREGRRLFRREDGRLIPIRRIYNRVVFDELERRAMALPFSFDEALDVSFCPHPNWYWVWSKYSLLHLDHPAVPRALLLASEEAASLIQDDPAAWVLKPLFSFAGSGVRVEITAADIAAIPQAEREGFILQRKIEYARDLLTPEGARVAAEIRVMCLRPPGETRLVPAWNLVRLSRGKMMGVDQNRDLEWVGSSVALWPATRSPAASR